MTTILKVSNEPSNENAVKLYDGSGGFTILSPGESIDCTLHDRNEVRALEIKPEPEPESDDGDAD